ncbi:MAG: hypothetical protein KDE27_06495, partial [Planctomycetes bacterium]|nr:hypothetical protein [Planctomycetota bacterium]
MSSKHRHGLPRKRPGRSKQQDIDAELPTLEATDAAELEPVEDGPVQVTCEGGESEDEAVLAVEVPAMDKQAVAAAVEGPLRAAVARHAGTLRYREVVVRFGGEALIGSAMKDVVKDIVGAQKPVKITVKRGFGDEVVHEAPLPQLEVATSEVDGVTTARIATGELERDDLPRFFTPVLEALAADASGKRLQLEFDGCRPDAELRDRIAERLRAAGAVRVALGARVLFDRELTDRCRVEDEGDEVVVRIDPATDPAITGEAMETVLPDHALSCAGKTVRVHWQKSPDNGEGDHFVRLVSQFAPEHIEFAVAGGEPKVVWPGVLEVVAGAEVVLRVRPHGRSHSEVLAALPHELADLEGELRGSVAVVDWPKLFVIDDETERCLADAMAEVGPRRVACTVAGEDREPFLPPPVALAVEPELCTVTLDTDAGRPAELVRAIERALPKFTSRLAGKPARVAIRGEAPATRTLLRAILDRVVDAGPTRLELEDHGPVDVLLPPLLKVARSGEHDVRIEADPADRDAAQVELALNRELDELGLPKAAVVTLVPSALDQALLAALIERGADSVVTTSGTQLYPEVLPEPEPEPEPEVLPEPEPELMPEPEPETAPVAAAAAPIPTPPP